MLYHASIYRSWALACNLALLVEEEGGTNYRITKGCMGRQVLEMGWVYDDARSYLYRTEESNLAGGRSFFPQHPTVHESEEFRSRLPIALSTFWLGKFFEKETVCESKRFGTCGQEYRQSSKEASQIVEIGSQKLRKCYTRKCFRNQRQLRDSLLFC